LTFLEFVKRERATPLVMTSAKFHVVFILSAGLMVATVRELVSHNITIAENGTAHFKVHSKTNTEKKQCAEVCEALGQEIGCEQTQCTSCEMCQSTCDVCKNYIFQYNFVTGCALDECLGCEVCSTSEVIRPADCTGYVREEQSGMKCGKHAVNAILKNSGKFMTDIEEMDRISNQIGAAATAEGDYDLAALLYVLKSRFGGSNVQSVGVLGAPLKTIQDLCAEVGSISDVSNEAAHLRDELKRQEFTFDFGDVTWVVCGVGYHWKTYFRHPSVGFCDLDSQIAASGKPAPTIQEDELQGMKCQAIIVPTGQ